MTVQQVIEADYKGFEIQRRGQACIVITAVKNKKDKLDEVLLARDDFYKYHFWQDDVGSSKPQTQEELVKLIKHEIDRYDAERTSIIDEIITEVSH